MKPYLGYSFALHTAAMTAVMSLSSHDGAPKSPVYSIDFVGPTSLITPGEASKPAAATAPARPEPQSQPSEFQTRKNNRRAPLPKPSLLRGWRAENKFQTEPTATTKSAKGEADPGASPGSAGIATDMQNFPYPWYISQIRARLWSQWSGNMPATKGEAVVVFTLLPQGKMVDLKIESSSGDGGFDLAALACAEDAGPYPPLPSGFGEPFLKIHVTLAGGSTP